jgi:hypothetical protein
MVVMITTHGVAGMDVAVGTTAGMSEAAGLSVSVGCFVDAGRGVLDGRPVGINITAAVGKAENPGGT